MCRIIGNPRTNDTPIIVNPRANESGSSIPFGRQPHPLSRKRAQ